MTTLKELYTTLKSLRDMNLPVDDKLLEAADNLEEQIIKEQILPALSQNIEPLLSEIQRELVLMVEYHPGEPISVALSRKAKISEIVDAKQLTPRISTPVVSSEPPVPSVSTAPTKTIVNKTKGLKVTFQDGTVICESTAIATEIAAFQKIGFAKVAKLDIIHSGINLVSRTKREPVPGKIWQHECEGWYIYSNVSNQTKMKDLQAISTAFNLNLIIEEAK